MNTREVAAEYRLAQWTQTIQARVQSGQSIKEFCASAGISRNAYFYWQRKLREAACNGHVTLQSQANGLVPNGWTQLAETDPATVAVGTLTVEINGCRITATAETDLELLAKVCRALRSL